MTMMMTALAVVFRWECTIRANKKKIPEKKKTTIHNRNSPSPPSSWTPSCLRALVSGHINHPGVPWFGEHVFTSTDYLSEYLVPSTWLRPEKRCSFVASQERRQLFIYLFIRSDNASESSGMRKPIVSPESSRGSMRIFAKIEDRAFNNGGTPVMAGGVQRLHNSRMWSEKSR